MSISKMFIVDYVFHGEKELVNSTLRLCNFLVSQLHFELKSIATYGMSDWDCGIVPFDRHYMSADEFAANVMDDYRAVNSDKSEQSWERATAHYQCGNVKAISETSAEMSRVQLSADSIEKLSELRPRVEELIKTYFDPDCSPVLNLLTSTQASANESPNGIPSIKADR